MKYIEKYSKYYIIIMNHALQRKICIKTVINLEFNFLFNYSIIFKFLNVIQYYVI